MSSVDGPKGLPPKPQVRPPSATPRPEGPSAPPEGKAPPSLPPRGPRDANRVTAPLHAPSLKVEVYVPPPGAVPLSPQGPPLVRGSVGDEVATLQGMLNAAGFRHQGEPIPVDRRFGASTEGAVRQLQAQQGLRPDGVAGPDTKEVLEANLHLIQARQALMTATAEGAVVAKRLADQATRHLEHLPPEVAKALRQQLFVVEKRAAKQAEEAKEEKRLEKPKELSAAEAKAKAQRESQQAEAEGMFEALLGRSEGALRGATTEGDLALALALQSQEARNAALSAGALDQGGVALRGAQKALAEAQAAWLEAQRLANQAPHPEAFRERLAALEERLQARRMAHQRAQEAIQAAIHAHKARAAQEAEAQQRATQSIHQARVGLQMAQAQAQRLAQAFEQNLLNARRLWALEALQGEEEELDYHGAAHDNWTMAKGIAEQAQERFEALQAALDLAPHPEALAAARAEGSTLLEDCQRVEQRLGEALEVARRQAEADLMAALQGAATKAGAAQSQAEASARQCDRLAQGGGTGPLDPQAAKASVAQAMAQAMGFAEGAAAQLELAHTKAQRALHLWPGGPPQEAQHLGERVAQAHGLGQAAWARCQQRHRSLPPA